MEKEDYFLSDSHRKNYELSLQYLKHQKPFSKEEMKAQYLKLKEKEQEI